jgi:hypothetical protein
LPGRTAGLLSLLRRYPRAVTGQASTAKITGQDSGKCESRVTKLKQKISGCLRTFTGAGQFCAVRSYLSTAAKHGLPFFDALVMLTAGRP